MQEYRIYLSHLSQQGSNPHEIRVFSVTDDLSHFLVEGKRKRLNLLDSKAFSL
jgi:hypothetical protein